ncbi:Gag-pol polyprotein [Frankliniella fusca]|uniref:Gag-pol polyprotein n=1 Tax=Frankliniella fusca TaxID=407009 RepID=A0AAE1HEU1_9NEOP|nr:Gag-pol polyprotein [Frankliniella fusca]
MLFGRYHADFLGPLQASEPDGYRCVLVVVEAFSSWPEAIPLRTLQAEEVARALVTHVFSRLGAPYSIVTDQATTFESSLFKEVMDIYKIHKCRISGGKPSSNGKVENYIRSLTRQIAILANEEPSNWPDLIPHVLHAYRAAVNDVTGFSPYEILFGRQMRVPQDMASGLPPAAVPGTGTPLSYPARLRERLDKIHTLVRENTAKAAIRMKERYDKFSTLTYFKPGDIVMLYNRRRRRGKSTKLYGSWEGPYVIIDLLNDCIARIEQVQPAEMSKRPKPPKRLIVHVDRLAAVGSHLLDQNVSLNIFKEDDDDLDLDSCSLASDLEELSLETRMEVDNEFGLSFGDFGPPSAISTVAAAASAAPASAVPAPAPAPTAPVTASASAPPRAPVRRVSRIPRRRPQPPAQPPARAPAQPQAQAQPQARPRAQAQPQPQAQPRAQPPTQPQAQPRAQPPTQPQPRQPSRGHTQARQRASIPAGQRKRPAQPPRRSAGSAARAPKRSAPGHVSRNQPKRKRHTPQKELSELRGHVQKLQQEIATLRQVSVPAQGPPMQMAMPSMPSPYAMPFPMFMPPMYPMWRQ